MELQHVGLAVVTRPGQPELFVGPGVEQGTAFDVHDIEAIGLDRHGDVRNLDVLGRIGGQPQLGDGLGAGHEVAGRQRLEGHEDCAWSVLAGNETGFVTNVSLKTWTGVLHALHADRTGRLVPVKLVVGAVMAALIVGFVGAEHLTFAVALTTVPGTVAFEAELARIAGVGGVAEATVLGGAAGGGPDVAELLVVATAVAVTRDLADAVVAQ